MSDTVTKFDPGQSSDMSKNPVKARLKWFNFPKGFGFVNPENRPDIDAFLHITILQQANIQNLGEGALLMCEIEYRDKGAHVIKILDVLHPGALSEDILKSAVDDHHDDHTVLKMSGIVKWYKDQEGFGFIIPEDGLKDVFIHKTCLDRHGIPSLEAGQKVSMIFRIVPKGREVLSFELIK